MGLIAFVLLAHATVLSFFIATTNHPMELAPQLIARILLFLSRLSFLRFADSPGTLHLPGTAQPAPEPRRAFPVVLDLPPTGALAEDLYRAYRVGDESCALPEQLGGCPEGMQASWRKVAGRVEQLFGLPPRPPQPPAATPSRTTPSRTTSGILVLSLALAVGLFPAACTPAQQKAAAGALRGVAQVIDLALCQRQAPDPQAARRVGEQLTADPKVIERQLIARSQDIGCALLELATLSAQAGPLPSQGEVGLLLLRRAEVCALDGGCRGIQDQAARLLVEGARAGHVRLPRSGEG